MHPDTRSGADEVTTPHHGAGDTLSRVEAAYESVKGVTRDLHREDRIVEDLHIDSLATLEMLLRIEESSDIEIIDNPQAARITTVGELTDFIEAEQARGKDEP